MKLLIVAQTPPPYHGQSQMVATMLAELRRPDCPIQLVHLNLNLSRDRNDVGNWRWAKVAATIRIVIQIFWARVQHGPMDLYYVPAPGGKKGALWRDWVILAAGRLVTSKLILHWHAAGLGQWLDEKSGSITSQLSQLFMGGADLSIVLGESLRADAAFLNPRRIKVIRNGIPDPLKTPRLSDPPHPQTNVLFISQLTRSKGVIRAIEAVNEANRRLGNDGFQLTIAGEPEDPSMLELLHQTAASSLTIVGPVSGDKKYEVFSRADILIFPTTYEAETQGLVVAEALAHGLAVVVTDWRAVAENLPVAASRIVPPPGTADVLADALGSLRENPPEKSIARKHFVEHYSCEVFGSRVVAALKELN